MNPDEMKDAKMILTEGRIDVMTIPTEERIVATMIVVSVDPAVRVRPVCLSVSSVTAPVLRN
jgi:hypothetical protein